MAKAPAKKIEAPEPEIEEIEDLETTDEVDETEDEDEGGSLSASAVAALLGTDGRTLRKFLRASPHYVAVGQGNRYKFDEEDVELMKERFEKATKRAKKEAAAKAALKKASKKAVVPDPDDVLEDELADELEEIEL